jgi:hypothetical protein
MSVVAMVGLLSGAVFSFSVSALPRSRLILQSSRYVSGSQPYFRDSAETLDGSAAVRANGEWRFRKFHFSLRGEEMYDTAERWNYLNLHELAVEYRPSEHTAIAFGRKLYIWNEWETLWHQGVFQPRYMLNKLRSEPAGLTGVFAEAGSRDFHLTAGVLANVPDLGAHFYIRDNKFYSANPWFNPPADTFVYNSNLQEIRYSMDKPVPLKVIAKPGFSAKAEYQSGRHFFRGSLAYKPMSQFLLGFASRNQVVLGDDADYMRVRIQPRLAYHQLYGADYVAKISTWVLSVSATHEHPVADSVPEDFTAQQVGSAWISALQVSHMLEDEGPQAARVSWGYLKVNGGDRPDRGDLAGRETLFERRYQYSDALMLSLNKPFRRGRRFPIETEARWIYDRSQSGGVFSLSAGQNISRAMRVAMEADFLGLLGRDARVKDGFLSVYRANDRVGLGMSYVF